jgi:predicted ATPase/DNA-binding CsgD family transcriptional regulator/transcriptional regulator with XRE-family HTH domain/tetratricopeptide (TPR) repeat protein
MSDAFGSWVAASRRALGLTQVELAAEVGCTTSMLKKIETGGRVPSPQLRARIDSIVQEVQPLAAPSTAYPAKSSDPLYPSESIFIVLVTNSSKVPQPDESAWPIFPNFDPADRSSQTLVAPSIAEARARERSLEGPIVLHAGLSLDKVARVAQEMFRTARGTVCSQIIGLLEEVPMASADSRVEKSAQSLHLPSDRFVGRDDAVATVRKLVTDREHRLVTIVGPPGAGKTRLALEVVALVQRQFETVVVDLSTVETAAEAFRQIVTALRAPRIDADDPSLRLLQALKSWSGVLLLDNVEQVREIALPLSAALADSSAVVLLTSRVPLRVRGEHEVVLPPFDVPSPSAPRSELLLNPAIELFLDRSRIESPSMHTIRLIADICERLDGLPLAIELAASRAKQTPVIVLRNRLRKRFDDLSTNLLDLPERHRTLTAAVDWSVSLLSDTVANMLARLALFQGPFDLDAVATVGLRWPHFSSVSPAEAIGELESHHLVRRRNGSGSSSEMWTMYATVREVMRRPDRLSPVDLESTANDLRRFVLHQTRLLADSLYGNEQFEALELLRATTPDLLSTLSSALDLDAPEPSLVQEAADVTGRLLRFWSQSGLLFEGRELSSRLRLLPEVKGPVHARLCVTEGTLALFQGDLLAARVKLLEGLEKWTIEGNHQGIGDTLANLAGVSAAGGDLGEAEALMNESLENYVLADDLRGRGIANGNLGSLARERQDFAAAEDFLRKSAQIHRERGDQYLLIEALLELAISLEQTGDHRAAFVVLREAFELEVVKGSDLLLASSLETLALVNVSAQTTNSNALTSTRLLGSADVLRRGIRMEPPTLGPRARAIVLAGTLVGVKLWRSATEEGAALSRSEVLALAASVFDDDQDRAKGVRTSSLALTTREIEILSLVARGSGDKAVAKQIGLAPATVSAYMRNVLAKLGVPTRAAAVRVGMELGFI